MCGCQEEDFWKLVTFGHFLPRPQGPRGARDLKFTIYVPLVPKMLHTKFEKNWTSSYQEEVKNVQLLTHDAGRKPIAIGHLSLLRWPKNVCLWNSIFINLSTCIELYRWQWAVVYNVKPIWCINKRHTGLKGHLSILAHTGSLIFAFLKSLNTVWEYFVHMLISFNICIWFLFICTRLSFKSHKVVQEF